MKKILLLGVAFIACLTSYAQIVLLSGVNNGSYHLLAEDIKKISSTPIEVRYSGGSNDNFLQLKENKGIDIAFLQYDVLLYKEMQKQIDKSELQVLLPMAYEEIHLITLNDSTINGIKDLKGRKVAIGSPDQGTNITAKLIKLKTGIEWIDVEIAFNDAFVSLLSNEIDAFFFVGATPVEKLSKLSRGVSNFIKLIPIEDERLNDIYSKVQIRANNYRWIDKDINTYAVKSVLVCNTVNRKITDADIELLLSEIDKNLSKLQTEGHAKWKQLDFYFEDIHWPLHPATKKIFID